GFCGDCGAQMFWRNDKNDYLSVTAGCIDDTTELAIGGHVFTSEKSSITVIPESQVKFLRYWSTPPQ
ncbi:MAG: GFA family protein, partial [Pseudomonadota bacterium]